MTDAVNVTTPGFQVGHASGLHAVERELAKMHMEMLRQSGEEARSVRLSVLNLVAACTDDASAELAGRTVALIAASHPARAIIIVADRSGPDHIDADLSLQCSIVGDGQVCAEQVRINVSGEPSQHLASVVLPLLASDVPVFLWLVGAPPLEQALRVDAIAICERLIVDTGAYSDAGRTLSLLTSTLNATLDSGQASPRIADLAWARSRRWRELIVQAFDAPELHHLVAGIERLEIVAAGDRVPSQAWLLAGWMASRLGWKQGGGPEIVTGIDKDADIPARDLVSVLIRCRDGQSRGQVSIERHDSALRAAVEVEHGSKAAITVPYVDVDTAHLVGMLIEDDADDPIYADALSHAARLCREAGS